MEPVAVYKLIILYMLDRAGGEIAMPRTSSFLIENGYANFESLVQTYAEIVKNGFVTEIQKGDLTFLRITEAGEETLGFFTDQLSRGIKKQVREYLKNMGREIVNEESVFGEYYRSTYGDYTVHLVIREKIRTAAKEDVSQPVVSVDLAVPDETAARKAVESWKIKSGDIYRSLLENLL